MSVLMRERNKEARCIFFFFFSHQQPTNNHNIFISFDKTIVHEIGRRRREKERESHNLLFIVFRYRSEILFIFGIIFHFSNRFFGDLLEHQHLSCFFVVLLETFSFFRIFGCKTPSDWKEERGTQQHSYHTKPIFVFALCSFRAEIQKIQITHFLIIFSETFLLFLFNNNKTSIV